MIIGAGVVGLAIAARLSERYTRVAILEKNSRYGLETSSRNSEVIHAGIYYQPGSLKASLCVEGREELYSICRKYDIPHLQITKIIVASTDDELPALEKIFRNGLQNGVDLRMLDAHETLRLEPNIKTAGAIYSPRTGIISAHALMDYYFHQAENHGATIQCNCEVVGIDKANDGYRITVNESNSRSTFTSDRVVNAAGLYSDHIASLAGMNIDRFGYRLHFCKGSYFSVASAKAKLLSRLVYPVPTKDSLGVHALLDLGGRLRFGPDVEYLPTNVTDYSVTDERRSQFLESIRKILPSVEDDNIAPDFSGIRPKLQTKDGLSHDFVIRHEKENGLEGFVNLIGIESPGLTASPAIARYVDALF